MNTGTKDEVKGTAHEVKGAVKATTGKVTGDSKLEAEGHVEKAAGKVQKKIGEVEKVIDKYIPIWPVEVQRGSPRMSAGICIQDNRVFHVRSLVLKDSDSG